MDNQIRYTVTANDMLSGKLQGMNSSAQALEGTMGGLSKIMGTLGVGFAVFKGLEFVKEGVEKVEQLHQAMAQVEAGLESTGGAAGMTMESLKDMAGEMSARMKFGKADIMDMQAQMLTFGGLTKENFPAIGDAIANVASRIGMDLHGMSIQFGKAMDNPSEGIKKLSRQGVLFSKEQADAIDKLVAKGDIVKAQQIMLTEIQNKYGGSAAAAFNADPLARFNKMMGSLKMSVGEFAMEILTSAMPALENIGQAFKDLGGWIKDVVHWFKEHQNVSEFLKDTLGALVTLIVLYSAQQKIMAMWTAFTTTSMIAQIFTAGALTAGFEGAGVAGMGLAGVMALIQAVNPVVWIIAGIALLIAGVVMCYNHFAKFRGVIWAVWGVIKEFFSLAKSVFSALADIIIGVFTLDLDQIKRGFEAAANVALSAGQRVGKAASDGYTAGMKDFSHDKVLKSSLDAVSKINETVTKGTTNADMYARNVSKITTYIDKNVKSGLLSEDDKKKTLAGLKGFKGKGDGMGALKPFGVTDEKKDKTKAVSGNKVVTINVSIGNLINDFQIKTTNLQESTTAIKDKVLQALTSAVNDSQLVAGQ